MDSKLYSKGSRRLQDRFDTRRIADRLEKVDLLEADLRIGLTARLTHCFTDRYLDF